MSISFLFFAPQFNRSCPFPPPSLVGKGQSLPHTRYGGGGESLRICIAWILFLVLTVLFCHGWPKICYADNNDPSLAGTRHYITPEAQLEFANQYFSNTQFDRAIAEYERFIFFFPAHPKIPHVKYQLARAYFNNRQFAEALTGFKEVAESEPGSPPSIAGYFDVADCYVQLKDFRSALGTLSQVTGATRNTNIKDYAHYQTGWIFIENRQWENSKAILQKISSENLLKFQTESLLATLDTADDIPQKSPALSGILSIVPGGGYLYCHRPKDALMAFLLNGGLIWAAAEAFDNNSPALGSVITFVEIGFYGGNIYGGISSAHKYNARKIDAFIDALKKNHKIRFSLNPSDAGIGLTLQTPF